MPAVSSSVPSEANACLSEAQSSCSPLSLLVLADPSARWSRGHQHHRQKRQNQLDMLALSPSPSSFYPEQVPDAIKSQYQFPPPLIAPAAIRDGELICNGIPEESQTHLLNSEHLATQAEQQEVSEGRAGIPKPIFLPSHHSCLWK